MSAERAATCVGYSDGDGGAVARPSVGLLPDSDHIAREAQAVRFEAAGLAYRDLAKRAVDHAADLERLSGTEHARSLCNIASALLATSECCYDRSRELRS